MELYESALSKVKVPFSSRDFCKKWLRYLLDFCHTYDHDASNPLLFLYRHILKKDFGEHKDIPRAMKSKCCESEYHPRCDLSVKN
ncbi:MAG TPA: hypothetical protein VK452_02135 [Dissulfurispiraceae bacterium]|nr:hypothetical protein [Dissulfurispiraceae bacterium]